MACIHPAEARAPFYLPANAQAKRLQGRHVTYAKGGGGIVCAYIFDFFQDET